MLGRTHVLAGIIVGSFIAPFPNIAVIALSGIGSLLPDIDHPSSKVSRKVGILATPIHLTVKHRGVFHSGILGVVLIALALAVPTEYGLYRLYALAIVGGWWSHLLLDALTASGIPLFYPLRHRFSLLPIQTGSIFEDLFSVGLMGLMVFRVMMLT